MTEKLDKDRLDAAFEAYWAAEGGTFKGIEAAIEAYLAIGCAKCGAAVHSDDPQPGDWCMDCNMAFSPSENDFANKGKRIRATSPLTSKDAP